MNVLRHDDAPRSFRAMSQQRTLDLIEHLLDRCNPRRLVFHDDPFAIQRNRVIGICREILRRDLYVEWTCESRIGTMDSELMRWMHRAGCVKVYYGLESGSPRLLQTMKKRITPKRVRAGARLNRELGMCFCFFNHLRLSGGNSGRPRIH